MHKEDSGLFKDSDVGNAGDMLKGMLIKALVEQRITFGRFSELHRNYMLRAGYPANKIASSRNNLLKAMFNKKTLSYKMFEFIMKNILGLNLINITMTLKDRENKPYLLSMERITF